MNKSDSGAFFRWKPATWLRVTGADSANFLQGQLTNELRGAPAGSAVYGLWLNVKGKVVADSFVLRRDAAAASAGAAEGTSEYWVGSYFSPAAVIRERLESFIIADDVMVEDVTGEWAGISLIAAEESESGSVGAGGSGSGSADTELAGAVAEAGGFVFRGRRQPGGNVELVYPLRHDAAVSARLAAGQELGADEVARRRIAAGVPAIPPDLGPGDLPNEGGLEADAISYTKGCYLGQEVMARLKSMGQVRRRLLRVASVDAGALPVLPAPLFAGARQVGELRSAVADGTGAWIGLAMLALMHVSEGASLALTPGGPPVMRIADTISPARAS